MPYVQVTLLKGRSTEQKRRMAERIADVVSEEGKTAREGVTVTFIDVEPDSYSRGGVLMLDRQKDSQKDSKT
ncbi:MAG TPA: tautomerase family protein [Terriglobales bacterium]|jgi:4-oxalocrotonate tautomerase|nr:tautomerase family protein [Terriglobales bacterium]